MWFFYCSLLSSTLELVLAGFCFYYDNRYTYYDSSVCHCGNRLEPWDFYHKLCTTGDMTYCI